MPHPSSTFLQLDFRGAIHLGFLEIMFAFLFVDLFDNVGTLVGVCEQGGFIKDGKIPRVGRALLADATGTIFGSLAGTSTVTSYIESVAGIAAGARTGLSNVFVAGAFCARHVLLAAGHRDSGLRHRPRSHPGGRVDDAVDRAHRLGRFQRSRARIHHHAGHASDLQHRHRPQPGTDFLHGSENRSREKFAKSTC